MVMVDTMLLVRTSIKGYVHVFKSQHTWIFLQFNDSTPHRHL